MRVPVFARCIPLLALFALCLPASAFAESADKITYSEGKLRVIRATSVLTGTAGMSAEAGDIVETGKPGFALIELADGTVIALGEASRLMLAAHAPGNPDLLMLEGWMKLQSPASGNGSLRVSTLVQSINVGNVGKASLIVHGNASSGEVFVESGSANVGLTDILGRPAELEPVKSGQFISRAADKPPVSQTRPAETFVKSMPAAFRDALPSRLQRFKGKTIEAKEEGPASYADIGDWLTAPQSWRIGFVARFAPLLSDAEFRQQVQAHMKSHPEWSKVSLPRK